MDEQGLDSQNQFSVADNTDLDGSKSMDLDFGDNDLCDKNHDVVGEGENLVDNDLEPKTGVEFNTTKEAYNYYNSYARMIGFSVRKQRTNRSTVDRSKILRYTLCCACEGSYTKRHTPIKKREERRFGCKAEFEVKLNKNEKYELVKFFAEHTHELLPLSSGHLLRSQRGFKPSQAGVVHKMYSAGIQRSKIHTYFCEEAGGAEHVGFTKKDCSNLIQRARAEIIKKGDARCLLEYFKGKKRENRQFFYSFRTNDEDEISGVFFCDATSRRDYGLFGDTMCFDTTFKTNNYNMFCAPFVGVNNHGQTTLFGCGLIERENTDAFVWLFNTFLEAMGGKKPITIFTDQAMAIANAISIVFPECDHRLCLWHIFQNALKNLVTVFSKFKSFSDRFKECIYEGETIEEFEETWVGLLKDFELEDNEWLENLYKLREKWAQVYARAHFCAGMTTTQRSESINKYLKQFFSSNIILQEFVKQYAKAMDARREKEREEDKTTRTTIPELLSDWLVEREASKIYTRKIFNIFKEEYKKTLDLKLQADQVDGDVTTFIVEKLGSRRRNRTLIYNQSEQSVKCTCRMFEFQGILCCHALKLFRDMNFMSLPSCYYMKRWTKNIVDEVVFDSYGEAILRDMDSLATTRYSELSHISQRVVAKGAKSKKLCSYAKSEMLQLEVKLDAMAIEEEKLEQKTKKKKSSKENDKLPDLNENLPLKEPKKKQGRGSAKRNKSFLEIGPAKKRTSSKQNDGQEEASRITTRKTKGRTISVNNSTQASQVMAADLVQQQPNYQNLHIVDQDLFGLAQGYTNQHSYSHQILPSMQDNFHSYSINGYPQYPQLYGTSITQYGEQNTGLIIPSDFTSQQASSSEVHELPGAARRIYFREN